MWMVSFYLIRISWGNRRNVRGYCHIGGKGMTSETRCEAAGVVGTNTGLPQQRPVSAGVVQARRNQCSNLLPLGTGIAGFG